MSLDKQISEINSELDQIDAEISRLKERKSELMAVKKSLQSQKTEAEAEKLAKSHNWESDQDFPWSQKIKVVLKEKFKLSSFRYIRFHYLSRSNLSEIMRYF